jgi:hypothetical protein
MKQKVVNFDVRKTHADNAADVDRQYKFHFVELLFSLELAAAVGNILTFISTDILHCTALLCAK